MVAGRTTGQILRALMDRAGFSVRAFAQAAGYKHGSGVQRYIDDDFDKRLQPDVAVRLADALSGRGQPPIDRSEVLTLTGIGDIPPGNAVPVQFEGASLERVPDNCPVFGTALGSERWIEGEAIEQTMLNQGEIIEYRKRPPISNGVERVYGLYVQGSSMYPAHRDGAFLFAQRDAPLRADDDVVVYLRAEGDEDDGVTARAVLVKRLRRRSASYVELEQYNPQKVFRIAMEDIVKIDRVLTTDDFV